jgi:hypothetical protein
MDGHPRANQRLSLIKIVIAVIAIAAEGLIAAFRGILVGAYAITATVADIRTVGGLAVRSCAR